MIPFEMTGLHSHEAETAAIGCALLDKRALQVVATLREEDFYTPEYQRIFRAIVNLVAQRKPVDLVTVDTQLTANGDNTQSITNRTIDCSRSIPTTANVEVYVDRVRACSQRRQALSAIEQAAQQLRDPTTDTLGAIDGLRGALRDIQTNKSDWADMMRVMLDTFSDLDMRRLGERQLVTSGLIDLDRRIGGFYAGELTIIGARPGVGKSALAANIATAAAAQHGKRVCVCSLEMSAIQYGYRLLSKYSDVGGMKLRKASVNDDEMGQLVGATDGLSALPINFTFSTRTIEALRVEVQNRMDAEGVDLLVVDYLQLMRTSERFQSEHLRISHISRMLKEMAVDFGIPIIVLSQLKRLAGGLPKLEDLKESGSIEQDADGVILMHRPESSDDKALGAEDYDTFASVVQNKTQYIILDIAKQRQGETGKVHLVFDPAHMRYACLSRRGQG